MQRWDFVCVNRPAGQPAGTVPSEKGMKRKAYVRVSHKITHLSVPIEIVAGVELDTLFPVSKQYAELRNNIVYSVSPTALNNYSDAEIATSIEARIIDQYPGKSYFLEVGRGALDEYVQVFEP